MSIMKRILPLLLSLCMALSLCACQSGEGEPAAPSGTASETPAASAGPEATQLPAVEADLTKTLFEFCTGLSDVDTAVTVNGTEIPNELYFYWLASDCYQIYMQYMQYGMTADFSDEELVGYLREDVKTAVTYYAVLRQLAEENGVAITAENQAELESVIQESLAQQSMTREQLLQSYGLSEDSFQYVFTSSYLFAGLEDVLMGEPTEADLAQYVEDNGIFSCKHILLKTVTEDQTDEEGNVTQTADEYNAERQKLAEDLLAQIQAAEDPENLLDQLAEEHSEDGRNEDGTLTSPEGYTFDSTSSLVDGFREGTMALEVGACGIVETSYGYHVILRLPVDPSGYRDAWRSDGVDQKLTEAADAAEVTVSGSAETVDVADFFNRYTVYVAALYESAQPEESESVESAEP